LVLLAKNVFNIHSWVMAEALFIFFMLSALYCLATYLQSNRRRTLAFGAVLIGLSTLVRYLGLSLLLTGAVGILLLGRETWKRRAFDLGMLVAIALTPFVLLLVRNELAAGTMTNRVFALPPLRYEVLVDYVDSAFTWFVPARLGSKVRLGWKVVSLVLFLGVPPFLYAARILRSRPPWKASAQGRREALPQLLMLFILTYFVILASTIMFIQTSKATVHRYMTPVFIAVVVLEACVVYRLVWTRSRLPVRRAVALAGALALVGLYTLRLATFVVEPGPAFGYVDYKRTHPETVTTLEELDPSRLIITNEIYLLYFLVNRPAYIVPIRFDPYKQEARADFSDQMTTMRRRLEDGAYLVVFGTLESRQSIYPPRKTLTQGLDAWVETDDLAIYVHPDP
jgi:hypothetical protein